MKRIYAWIIFKAFMRIEVKERNKKIIICIPRFYHDRAYEEEQD